MWELDLATEQVKRTEDLIYYIWVHCYSTTKNMPKVQNLDIYY